LLVNWLRIISQRFLSIELKNNQLVQSDTISSIRYISGNIKISAAYVPDKFLKLQLFWHFKKVRNLI